MLGAIALLVQPQASWIEHAYSNGAYPVWEHVAFPVTNALPWSLGDPAALAGVAAIVWLIVRFARRRVRRTAQVGRCS